MDLEYTIQLGDLYEVEDFLPQPDQLDNSAIVPHSALGDEQGTQSATVAEVHFGEVDNEVVEFRTAQDEEFTFQLSRDGGVQLPLFQFEDRRGTVLPHFKIHKSSKDLKHCQTVEKVIVDLFRTARGVCPQLKVVESVGKLLCNADTHLRA